MINLTDHFINYILCSQANSISRTKFKYRNGKCNRNKYVEESIPELAYSLPKLRSIIDCPLFFNYRTDFHDLIFSMQNSNYLSWSVGRRHLTIVWITKCLNKMRQESKTKISQLDTSQIRHVNSYAMPTNQAVCAYPEVRYQSPLVLA